MNKLIYIIILAMLGHLSMAQNTYLVEHFDYPAGDSLQNLGWYSHSAPTTNPIKVHTEGLSWSQTPYMGSGVGNAAIVNNNGSDENMPLSSGISSGSAYVSFLLKLGGTVTASSPNNRGYFFHIGEYSNIDTPDFNSISFAFRARTFVTTGSSLDKFRLGLTFNSGTVPSNEGVDMTSDLDTGKTYLVVIKYEFIDGDDNDEISLYVFEDGDDISTEPSTPTLGPITGTQPDMPIMQYVALRQYNLNPDLVVDGIVVKDGWDLLAPIEFEDFSLLSPADGTRVELKGDLSQEVVISWEPTTAGSYPVTYQWVVDAEGGDFSNPPLMLPSDNMGMDNSLTLTLEDLDNAIASIGVAKGDSISLIWTVMASANDEMTSAAEVWGVKLVRDESVSVDVVKYNSLNIYPNPANNMVSIDFSQTLSSNAKIAITNVLGQETELKNVSRTAKGIQFSVNELNNGVYTVRVEDNGIVSTGTIMVQK